MGEARAKSSAQAELQAGGIFGHLNNALITGGNFTSVVSSAKSHDDEFKLLQRHVATTAFHNSAQRVDPPRCHENTRQAVLQEIFNWIVQDIVTRAAWLAWLNGAAGAGKSAICQSIAEMCILRGILVASFFFFRTDPTRSTINPLVATLAYQLILLVPSAKNLICSAIEYNPLIFEQSFETQFETFIIEPLRQLQRQGAKIMLLLIIDGLDECSGDENQLNIIRTISKFLAMQNSPIIVLVGSRAEHQLRMAFRARSVSNILLQLPLDEHYLPDNDIRVFLADKFAEIRETHSFQRLLPNNWPAPDLVQEIVDKSSGQFIYASVVINFVSFPRSNPAKQLDIVRGLRPSGLATPFAQLDALYRHILSTVQDIQTTIDILAYTIIGLESAINRIAWFFNVTTDDVETAFADMTSVLTCEDDQIRFLHASLPDFLLDQTRSQEYHIGSAVCSRLSVLWFENAASGRIKDSPNFSLRHLLRMADATPDLRARIVAFDPYSTVINVGTFFADYLTNIRNLDFSDDGDAYHCQLNAVIRYLKKRFSWEVVHVQKQHDISQILAEIENGKRTQPSSARPPKKMIRKAEMPDEGAPVKPVQELEASKLPQEIDVTVGPPLPREVAPPPKKPSGRSKLKAWIKNAFQ